MGNETRFSPVNPAERRSLRVKKAGTMEKPRAERENLYDERIEYWLHATCSD